MSVEVVREETWDFPLGDPSNRYRVRVNGYELLIDAGARPLDDGIRADFILVTHWHWDHTYGLSSITKGGVCMSKATLESLNPGRAWESMVRVARAVGLGNEVEAIRLMNSFMAKYTAVENAISRLEVYMLDECPPIRKGVVEYLSCPGHSNDHVCYLVGDHLFVGDNILSSSSTVTLTDLTRYNESMIRILANTQWLTAYPGHGKPLSRSESLEWFLNHHKHKTRRLLQVLSWIPRDSWVTLKEVMKLVYNTGDNIAMYVAARTLIGYINALEAMEIVEVDRSAAPWKLKIRSE